MQDISTLFDSLLEPSFVVDADYNIKYCNEAAAAFCGSSPRRMLKMNFKNLATFTNNPDWMSNLQGVTQSTPYVETKLSLSTDPETKRVQITCQKLPSENASWLIYVRDVTLEDRLQSKYQAEAKQKEVYIGELEKAQDRLEEYNKNLEKIVEERTLEVRKLSQLQTTLLDSLEEGFFVFDQSGVCLNVSSKSCINTVEIVPNGKPLEEVLKIPSEKLNVFKQWSQTLFLEMLPFEDIVPLGPSSFHHSEGKHIKLDYHPIRNEDSQVVGVVVVASDITKLVTSQKIAREEKEYAQLIINVVKNKNEVSRALAEIEKLIFSHRQAVLKPVEKWNIDDVSRTLHTIKGGAATYHFDQVAQVAHEAENQLAQALSEQAPSAFAKVSQSGTDLLNVYQNFKSQLVTTFGDKIFRYERSIEIPISEFKNIYDRLVQQQQNQIAYDLEVQYLTVPIGAYFESYKEMTKELAQKMEKDIAPVNFENANLPIYPENYTHLFGCLVHAFRNAVDHGIEKPELRLQNGKQNPGQIQVRFSTTSENKNLMICISDDGGGVNPDRIRKKLDEKNVSHAHETDEQVIQHIFDSSFSTKQEVTEISGRGVGLDAIRDAALKLGGTCWIESKIGQGSQLFIEVPYFGLKINQGAKNAA